MATIIKTKLTWAPAYGSDTEGNEILGDAQIDMSTQCLSCKHFRNTPITCNAYPKGIPSKIITGNFDHTKPFKGDNGIQFEKLKFDDEGNRVN